jgi:hypothetical protein
MRVNPFTGRPNDRPESSGDRHVVKPAGKTTLQMPGARLSLHCNEGERKLAALAEREMQEAEDRRRAGGHPQGSRGPADWRP